MIAPVRHRSGAAMRPWPGRRASAVIGVVATVRRMSTSVRRRWRRSRHRDHGYARGAEARTQPRKARRRAGATRARVAGRGRNCAVGYSVGCRLARARRLRSRSAGGGAAIPRYGAGVVALLPEEFHSPNRNPPARATAFIHAEAALLRPVRRGDAATAGCGRASRRRGAQRPGVAVRPSQEWPPSAEWSARAPPPPSAAPPGAAAATDAGSRASAASCGPPRKRSHAARRRRRSSARSATLSPSAVGRVGDGAARTRRLARARCDLVGVQTRRGLAAAQLGRALAMRRAARPRADASRAAPRSPTHARRARCAPDPQ